MAFLYVGVGGFFGCCLRYLFTLLFKHVSGIFAFGTLTSNVLAGLLIGLIVSTDMLTGTVTPKMKLLFVTGFLGGLSTFSTFSLETVQFFSAGRYVACGLNVFLNLFLSILGVVIGMSLMRIFLEAP